MALFGAIIYATVIMLVACSALLAHYISYASQESYLSAYYESIVSIESFSSSAGLSMPAKNSSSAQLSEWLETVQASALPDKVQVSNSNGILVVRSLLYPGTYSAIKLN